MLVNKEESLNIWSAACSTGDEPYSIAMMLNQYSQNQQNTIQILGTDSNHRVLQIAKSAAYSKSPLSFI